MDLSKQYLLKLIYNYITFKLFKLKIKNRHYLKKKLSIVRLKHTIET